MISPRKLKVAGDQSPVVPQHPMILRSTCRLCECDCTADYDVTPTRHSSVRSRGSYRENHSKHVNGNLQCQEHIQSEIYALSKDSNNRENVNSAEVTALTVSNRSDFLKEESSAEENFAQNISEKLSLNTTFFKSKHAKHSSAYARQKSDISTNLTLAKDSVFYKSFFKRIISSTSSSVKHSKSSTLKHLDSSRIRYSNSSATEQSDYSSGFEIGQVDHVSDVENCLAESMSRTKPEPRKSLSSVRQFLASDSNVVKGSSGSQSITSDLRRSQNVSEAFHSADRDFSNHNQNSEWSRSSFGRSFRSDIGDCNAEIVGSFSKRSSGSVFSSHPVEESSRPSLALNESSRFSLAGWLLEASKWLFWKCIYHNICEMLLFDAWTLSRCKTIGKRKIAFLFLLLLLLPFLLLGHFSENGDSQLSLHPAHILTVTRKSMSYFSHYLSSLLFGITKKENGYMTTCDETPAKPESLWFNFWNILPRTKSDNTKQSISPSVQSISHLVEDEGMSEDRIKSVAREIFKEESSQLLKLLNQNNEIKLALSEEANELKSLSHEMTTVYSKYQFLSDTLHDLKVEVNNKLNFSHLLCRTQNAESTSADQLQLSYKLHELETKVQALETLLVSAKNCCKNHSDYVALIDTHLTTVLKNVMEGKTDGDIPIFAVFRSWLNSNFVSYRKLSDEIATVVAGIHGDYLDSSKAHFEQIAKSVAESIIAESVMALKQDVINVTEETSTHTDSLGEALSVSDIQRIVKEAISLYDADKTGLVDYALESGGGSVVSTRCSETYNAGTARLTVFGIPLWFISNSPRTAIQPDMHPGQCWAFKGSQGFLVLQMSATIRPTGFSLEHIPESLSPTGAIDSAPRKVSIWGLASEKDNDGTLLAEYEYDKKGDPLQYIPVQKPVESVYSFIELKILSNWGNQKYTCLYRFRVHGSRL